MSADPREDIIARLLAIAAGLPGVVGAQRNDLNVGEDQLPVIVILDADEVLADSEQQRRRDGRAPHLYDMSPQAVILAMGLDDCGTKLNAIRRALIKAVVNDDTLLTLVGSNGCVRYHGAINDFGWARELSGKMAATFVITYALKPSQL